VRGQSVSCGEIVRGAGHVLRYARPMPEPIFPDVPLKGTVVSLQEIQRLCEAKGLHHLWQRIAADPPPKSFASDGCSLFFNQIANISIYPACFFHDLKYWCGYAIHTPAERLARFTADAELMVDVASLGVDFFIAETIFRGVRTGGGPIGLPYSWGFGRT
jgi:hypothetical protein